MPKPYALLAQANSFGVFQLESAGMRELLKKTQPSEFEDIISVLALYRPGPMGSGMLDDFIRRKRGEVEIKYDHPKLEPILKETYGIIVYQEQVMKIPVALAGFSMTQADHLRRAMSKKIPSVMEQMRKEFVDGCAKTSGIDDKKANKLFDLIDYFSGYGFNRSHSAAYALISYQTAYLKANYPVEFMCALLNSEKNNTDKIVEYVKECEAMGITVLPPDINESIKEFNVVNDHTVRFGLLGVKNVGSTAIDSVVENRQTGPYTSLSDLCARVDLRLVNRKVVESLIKCGALDSFKAYRAQMMAILDRALAVGAKSQKEKAMGQVSFFDLTNESGFQQETENLPDVKEWSKTQILSFEKEILGFYVSGTSLTHYAVEIKEFTNFTTKDLRETIDGEQVRLVGLLEEIKLTNTRKTNERMAIVRLEDMEGSVEVVLFPSTYTQLAKYLNEGEVVFLSGRVSRRDDEPKIIATDMKQMQEVYGAIKTINVDLAGVDQQKLEGSEGKIDQFSRESAGLPAPRYRIPQKYPDPGGRRSFVTPNEELMNEIKELVGDGNFSLTL